MRHCERSEAIHSSIAWRHGLLRFARNDGGYTLAFSRRIAPELCWKLFALDGQRAQGRPGARCTRGLVCNVHEKCAHEHTGPAESIRPSLRNGFTAYSVLSPENGSFASVAPRGLLPPGALTPAPRRRDHTSLPYASAALVFRSI